MQARLPEVPDGVGRVVGRGAGQVPAVAKAIAIIRLLNREGTKGASLSAIAQALGITRSHCHNILRTLVAHDWLRYEAGPRVYTLASGLAADAAGALASTAHLAAIRPLVQALAATVGFPVTLTEPLADGAYLVVDTAGYPDPYVSRAPTGYLFPPGTPPQLKPALAWLPAERIDAALDAWRPVPFTPTTITQRPALLTELALTRTRGYARSLGEFVEGFTTLALPVFDRQGEVVLVLSVAGRSRALAAREGAVADALIATVARIHAAIDGRPPVDFPRPD